MHRGKAHGDRAGEDVRVGQNQSEDMFVSESWSTRWLRFARVFAEVGAPLFRDDFDNVAVRVC
jgi:hypothetical protein